MRGAMGRALNAQLSMAWNQWAGHCDEVARLSNFASRMLNAALLKGWNKWYAQVEEYWRLRKIMRRMRNVPLARAYEHWLATLESQDTISRRTRGYATLQALKKPARAWRLWQRAAAAQVSRRRMNDTFRFSKQPGEDDLHAEAVDWRASLARGRTRGGIGLG